MHWKKIVRLSFSYGVSLILMQCILDGRGYGVGQDGRQIAEGLGNVMGKLGPSYWWAGGRVNIWVKFPSAVADLVDFCSGGLRRRHSWLQNCLCI